MHSCTQPKRATYKVASSTGPNDNTLHPTFSAASSSCRLHRSMRAAICASLPSRIASHARSSWCSSLREPKCGNMVQMMTLDMPLVQMLGLFFHLPLLSQQC